jgi:2-dehydro-3-deoxyphosphogluconate aldolase / (4S)-4-hydroxy-2-oxoglutarate aldolase
MKDKLLTSALHQKILPAVTFSSPDEVLPVAEALLNGGLTVMEIPFRTDVAAEAISTIRKNFPEMYVGAGTLLSIMQIKQALDAGAQFGLAPGFNPSLCKDAMDSDFPFVPGVMTPSEMESAAALDFKILKLFPAAQLDGIHFLKALQDPYESLRVKFIPMGGVSLHNIHEYLQLKNVVAVGGSWLANRDLISRKQFHEITARVKEALLKTPNFSA